MVIDDGQKKDRWADDWEGLTPDIQIQIWDFYGVRPYILRYVPRHGKVIEAGCGLGRVLFYLESLGIDIDGVDFEPNTLERLQRWRDRHGLSANLVQADVCALPYEDNSLSGYISLGVVEHFIEGPHRPLNEAYRVLRPGGLAIITTPSMSFSQAYRHAKEGAKDVVKKLIRWKGKRLPFRQYWFSPSKLKGFVEKSGLSPVDVVGVDLIYALYELGYRPLSAGPSTQLVSWLEGTPLAHFGAQSITISVKMAPLMHCFLCGDLNVKQEEMNTVVPVCQGCLPTREAAWYRKGGRMKVRTPYEVETPLGTEGERSCDYCGTDYAFDTLFETYGFTKDVCLDCLKTPAVNLELSNEHIRRVWRLMPRPGKPAETGRALRL